MVRQQVANADFPEQPGVYVVYGSAEAEQPLYVGVASRSLRQRWRQHLGRRSGQSALRRTLGVHLGLVGEKLKLPARVYPPDIEQRITEHLRSRYLELHQTGSGDEAKVLEHRLIGELKPLLNVQR